MRIVEDPCFLSARRGSGSRRFGRHPIEDGRPGAQLNSQRTSREGTANRMLVAELQELEEVKTLLAKGQAVEMVDDVDPVQAAAPTAAEPADTKRGRKRTKAAIDLKPDMTTDSLQLFLKDIGKVRLLTAQEEVDLA